MSAANIVDLTEGLIDLQQRYAHTLRKIITHERFHGLVHSKILDTYTFDEEKLREPLLEHVGHLPVIASYLHPHIEHKTEVDLGRALIMLSVHDIGETKVGDVLSYAKTKSHETREFEAAKNMLPDYLYSYFEEIEKAETLDGKFAKAVDAIAPLLHEMALPEILTGRLQYHKFTIDMIEKRKKALFAWDQILADMFNYLIERYHKIEDDQRGGKHNSRKTPN